MTGGLETVAVIANRLAIALAYPRLEWRSPPIEQQVHVGFEWGTCWSIAHRNDQVVVSALTEAGAGMVAELHRDDAMTAAALSAVEGT